VYLLDIHKRIPLAGGVFLLQNNGGSGGIIAEFCKYPVLSLARFLYCGIIAEFDIQPEPNRLELLVPYY